MADQPTDDKKPEVTEEQVKAHNDAEEARWQDDFPEEELKVEYKKADESKKDDQKNEADDEEEEESNDDDDDEQVVVETFADPEPVITVEDPGEYKAANYSFKVTLADGKTKTIRSIDEAELLAEDPDNFETPRQLMDFMNKQSTMRSKFEKDYEKWEEQHKTFTEQLETETERRNNVSNYAAEFQYLTSKGLLPAFDKEFADADWSDPEVAKQPGVKEHIALLDYMVKENEARTRIGVAPLTSVLDAYNAWQVDADRQKAEKDKKKAADERKARGARVAGVSPTQQSSYVPKGIAVGNPNVLKRGAAVWDNQK